MTILYIDDDEEDINLFCEAVETLNSTDDCIAVSSGRDGLDALRHIVPDIIFIDINMPIMGGMETLATIRRNESMANVPIYMFSTTTNQEELEVFKSMGATDSLTKPNTFGALCDNLRLLSDQHRSD